MLKYKIDILRALKDRGISSYKIRQDNIFGQRTLTLIRAGRVSDVSTVDRLCGLLGCQPGDLLSWVPDDDGGAGDASGKDSNGKRGD